MRSGSVQSDEPWIINFDLMAIGRASKEAAFVKRLYESQQGELCEYFEGQEYFLLDKKIIFTHHIVLHPRKKHPVNGRLRVIGRVIGVGDTTRVSMSKSYGFYTDIWGGIAFVPVKHASVIKERRRSEAVLLDGFTQTVSRESEMASLAGLSTKPALFRENGESALILQRRVPGWTFGELRRYAEKSPISVLTYLNIAVASLRELSRLHNEVNILHADINEDNVMVDLSQDPPTVAFIDFKCAHREGEFHPYTGHVLFAPPESKLYPNCPMSLQSKNTRASEVYSLGVLLYLLSGSLSNRQNTPSSLSKMRNLSDVTKEDETQILAMLSQLMHAMQELRGDPLVMAQTMDNYVVAKLQFALRNYKPGVK